MPIKKIVAMLLVIVILLSGMMMPAYADGIDSIIPPIDIDGATIVEADEYSMSAYTFDTEKMKITDVIPGALKEFANIIFFLNTILSKLVNFILVQAFQLDIFEYIEVIFDDLIFSLRDAIYKPLIGIVLPITGVAILFFAVVNKTTRALSLFFQSVIILVVAAIFMTAPSFVISMVNDVSQDLAGSSLSATASIVNGRNVNGNDAVVSLSNIYWGNAVSNPWQLIQFGELNPQKAEEYLSVDTSQRKTMAKAESNTVFKKEYQWLRLVLALFFFLLNIFQSALILILAGIMILTQFAAILAAITAILGFVISLLPNQGLRVAIHAIYNIFTFLLTRIGIMLLMCIYFAIATVLYRNINTAGWFFTMILQMILILTVVVYRNKIFSFVRSAAQGSQATMRSIENKPNYKRAALEGYAAMKIGSDVKRVWDNRANKNLERKYEPTAEKYLYKRYEKEKSFAEQEAERRKKPVQYSEFVRKTDARVERGFTPFSVDSLKSTTGMMVNIHRQGEDPDRLIMTKVSGKTKEQIRADQSNLESRIGRTKWELKTRENENERTVDKVIRTDKNSAFYDRRKAIIEGTKSLFTETPEQTHKDTAYYEAQTEATSSTQKTEAHIQTVKQTADGTTPQEMPQPVTAQTQRSGSDLGQTSEVPAAANETVNTKTEVIKSERENVSNVSEVQNVARAEDVNTVDNKTVETNENIKTQRENVSNVSEVQNVARAEDVNTVDNKTVETNENIKTQRENVSNVSEVQNVQKTEEVKNVENKNETVNKVEAINTTNEKTVKTEVNEKKDFINLETTTENQTKNINQTISNIQNNVVEKNEVIQENVINKSNVREIQNTNRNIDRENRVEVERARSRQDVFDKLNRLDKNSKKSDS